MVFFRPARIAILPRSSPRGAPHRELGVWICETLADVIGYPLAGISWRSSASAVPIAFWFDGATYLASAALLATIVVPARSRSADEDASRSGLPQGDEGGLAVPAPGDRPPGEHAAGGGRQFSSALRSRWSELRQADLQRRRVRLAGGVRLPRSGLGLGGLVGGTVIGLMGARFAKGRMVITGYRCIAASLIFPCSRSSTTWLPAIRLAIRQRMANMVTVNQFKHCSRDDPPSTDRADDRRRFRLVFRS